MSDCRLKYFYNEHCPKWPKTAQSGPRFPSIMSAPWQRWPNLFSCQAHLKKKHYQVYFITMQSELTWLGKQTNKQTNKHQDLSEKIHQLYIENTYFCFRRNANKKTLSDKNCFLSLSWACFSINYIFCLKGGGGQNCCFWDDIIYEWPLTSLQYKLKKTILVE